MIKYETKFSMAKLWLSLAANLDCNWVHRKPKVAEQLLETAKIGFKGIPQYPVFTDGIQEFPTIELSMQDRLMTFAGLRPRLPIVPGILGIMEGARHVAMQSKNRFGNYEFNYMKAGFNIPILADSVADIKVSPTENGYDATIDVPYNPLERKPATALEFRCDKPFSENVAQDSIDLLLSREDPNGKKVLLSRELNMNYDLGQFLWQQSTGRQFHPGPFEVLIGKIPALLISLIRDYKALAGMPDPGSVYLYNSQCIFVDRTFRPEDTPFPSQIKFRAAVKCKELRAGSKYTVETCFFDKDQPLVYGKSGAVELLLK